MLLYNDVAIVKFIRDMFPELRDDGKPYYSVVVAPPEGSRQALANVNKSADIGIPGLSVYRTDIAIDYERFTMPRARSGVPWGKFPDTKMWNNVKVIPVTAEYTIRGWARNQTDLADMERELAFSDIYGVIRWNIQGNNFSWPLRKGDVSYDPIMNKETGKVLFHSFKVAFEVDTQWIHTGNVPWIESIKVNFTQVLSGDPVTVEMLDKFSITFTPTASSVEVVNQIFADYTEAVEFTMSLPNLEAGTVSVFLNGVQYANDDGHGNISFANQINLLNVSGTVTAGDVVTLRLTNSAFPKAKPILIPYTCLNTDTPTLIATAISNLINTNPQLAVAGVTSTTVGSIINVATRNTSPTSFAVQITGAATEVVSIGNPVTTYAQWVGSVEYEEGNVLIQAVDLASPITVDILIKGTADQDDYA